jgi:hypothetical protein
MADVVGNDGAQPSSISYRKDIFNYYVPRGKGDKGSHTTSGRQHGSSQTLVIFFCVGIAVQAQASSQGANYPRWRPWWAMMVRNRRRSVMGRIHLTLVFPGGKETKVVIQQVADNMDQVKR